MARNVLSPEGSKIIISYKLPSDNSIIISRMSSRLEVLRERNF